MTLTAKYPYLVEILRMSGYYGDPETIESAIEEWREFLGDKQDFALAQEVDKWLSAGVFTASAAQALQSEGACPEDVAFDFEYAGQVRRMGYWIANGDIHPRDWRVARA